MYIFTIAERVISEEGFLFFEDFLLLAIKVNNKFANLVETVEEHA